MWSLSEHGTLLDILEGVGAPVSLLVRAGTVMVSASHRSSSFKIWDLTHTQKPRASAPFLDRTGLTAVSHNGSYVYFPKIGDKSKVTIWDLAEGLYDKAHLFLWVSIEAPALVHWAAVTARHHRRGSNNRHWFVTVLEAASPG